MLGASGSCSGGALDTFNRALAQIPESALNEWLVFEYLSPRAFASRGADPNGRPANGTFAEALHDPDKARRLTGIDLFKLDAILQSGAPGGEITFLAGPTDAFQGVANALTNRGFAASTLRNLTLYSIGNEGSFGNSETLDPVDPFGRGIGRSERIAVGENELTQANGSDVLRQALPIRTAIAAEAVAHFARMAAASQSATLADAEVLRVLGLSPTTLATPPLDQDTVARLDPDSREARSLHRLQEKPLRIVAVLFVLGASSQGGLAELAILYPDRATADAGVAGVRAGLQDFAPYPRPAGTTFGTRLIDFSPGGAVAGIVSVHFPPNAPEAASREVGVWIDATILRDLNFLAMFR
jgi:hypothetical protein